MWHNKLKLNQKLTFNNRSQQYKQRTRNLKSKWNEMKEWNNEKEQRKMFFISVKWPKHNTAGTILSPDGEISTSLNYIMLTVSQGFAGFRLWQLWCNLSVWSLSFILKPVCVMSPESGLISSLGLFLHQKRDQEKKKVSVVLWSC